MASARNLVISGDYILGSCSYSYLNGCVVISPISDHPDIKLTKETVKSYEILDAEQRKSGMSGILRAGAGALLLGPIGLAAGLTAKRKGIYTIAIEFYDGKRSLIEIGEEAYKSLIRNLF